MGALPWDGSPEIVRDVVVEEMSDGRVGGLCMCVCARVCVCMCVCSLSLDTLRGVPREGIIIATKTQLNQC